MKTSDPIRAVIFKLITENTDIFNHDDIDTLIYDYLDSAYGLNYYKGKVDPQDTDFLLSFFEWQKEKVELASA